MRFILSLVLLTFALAGCASAEYHDNTAEVARDPRCVDKPSIPGQQSAPWCTQKAGTEWSTGKGGKVDLSGKGKND